MFPGSAQATPLFGATERHRQSLETQRSIATDRAPYIPGTAPFTVMAFLPLDPAIRRSLVTVAPAPGPAMQFSATRALAPFCGAGVFHLQRGVTKRPLETSRSRLNFPATSLQVSALAIAKRRWRLSQPRH